MSLVIKINDENSFDNGENLWPGGQVQVPPGENDDDNDDGNDDDNNNNNDDDHDNDNDNDDDNDNPTVPCWSLLWVCWAW